MAKATKQESQQHQVIIAALKRALKTVESKAALVAAKDAPDRPEPGTHAVSFTVEISGDIVVAAPVTVAAKAAADGVLVSAEELLAAILETKSIAEVRKAVGGAMLKIAKARGLGKGNSATKAEQAKKRLAASSELVQEVIADKAKSCELWGPVGSGSPESVKAGAVTGMPRVLITGKHNQQPVSLDVEAEQPKAKKAA